VIACWKNWPTPTSKRRRTSTDLLDRIGQVLKEGRRRRGQQGPSGKLLRFASTANDSDEQNVSFEQYIARAKEGQDKIYYVTADNYVAAKNSPHLEIFRKKAWKCCC
jgi:HSP90 family molecular chaperone